MTARKEEVSWMDMLRQPSAPAQPSPKTTLQVKQPQQSSSQKELLPSSGGSTVAKSVSTPALSTVSKEQPPPVSVSQKVTSSETASSIPIIKHQSSSTALNASGNKEPSTTQAVSGLTWADALAVTAKPAAGGSNTGSQLQGSGSGAKDAPEQSWAEFLSNTNDNAPLNWMEALQKPMPAPAASANGTKVSAYLKNTIGKNSKKDGGDLGAYFGIDSKRKADDDDGHDAPDDGSAIKKKDRDRGATAAEKLSMRPAKAAIPEPQELREEGAILVLENNTYVVRAATPEKLVETLTSESRADLPFTNTFMLTFRAFLSPMDLYRLLMKRFNLPAPVTTHPSEIEHWKARVSTPTRLRVFIVIKMWVTFHWMDFERDPELLAAVKELPKRLREVGMTSPADMLVKLLEKKPITGLTWGGGNELMSVVTGPPPKPLLSFSSWPGPARAEFLRLPPEELARQLTLIEHDLFRVIPPWELLGMGWMKPDKNVRAPNILTNISRFNYVAQWVTSEVTSASTLKECQAIIEHMIRLMEECYNLQNYCSTLEVISGLEQTPVWRLKEVWANVNPKLRKSLEEKAKKFRSDKNWKKHRKLVQTAIPPCIPYLGMYLTDLVFADEIPKEREGYINFDKYRILARVIHELQLHQRTLYNLEVVPFLRQWWTTLRLLDEPTYYERSYQLVPRGGTQRAERRGSNSLAIRKATPPMAPARIPSEQSPSVTYAQLRNTFPFMVKDTILTVFPPEKFTFSSWRAIDGHGVVYGWSDEVEIYLAQNNTDTVVIHAAMNATKSDIYAVEHQVRLYDISAGDNRALRAAIIALVATPEVHTVAEDKGIEMIIVKELSVPADEVEVMPHMQVDTLARQAESAPPAPVVSPRGGCSSLQQFFATCNFGEDAATYLKTFQRECILPEDLPFLSMEVLTEMGVKMGHAMKMVKIIQQLSRD